MSVCRKNEITAFKQSCERNESSKETFRTRVILLCSGTNLKPRKFKLIFNSFCFDCVLLKNEKKLPVSA